MVPVVSQSPGPFPPACIGWPVWSSPINMSIISTVTALAEIDPTLGDDTMIANWICIPVAIQGDGTPMDPTSFREEDTMKLCVSFGQEHPEDVLQLSDTETVLAFSSISNMMAALCHFVVAMNWCGEPVRLCIWLLMTMQVNDYIAMWSSCPSGAQVPVQGEWWISLPSPASPTLITGPRWNSPSGTSRTWPMSNYGRCWRMSSSKQLRGKGLYPHTVHSRAVCRSLRVEGNQYGWWGSGLLRGEGVGT